MSINISSKQQKQQQKVQEEAEENIDDEMAVVQQQQQQQNNNNVWSTLPFPLCDIFLEEIAPKYLTIQEFVRLGCLSKRYKDLLGCGGKTTHSHGNKILAHLLKRESNKFHPPLTGDYLFTEQLPTIGNLSIDESLAHDAVLVAQLRRPALNRRRLITFCRLQQQSQQQQQNQNLQEIIDSFRPKSMSEMITVARKYHRLGCRQPRTEFLGINLSGVDIYCHYIADDGQILIRDGDRIPPKPASERGNQRGQQPQSFVVNGLDEDPTNNYIFRHSSQISHSFALCFEEGGPPFAIYQQRRGWFRRGTGRGPAADYNGTMHTHAISIHPGGIIQELYCDSHWSFQQQQQPNNPSFTGRYDFVDRNDGHVIPLRAAAADTVASTGETAVAPPSSSSSSSSSSQGEEEDQRDNNNKNDDEPLPQRQAPQNVSTAAAAAAATTTTTTTTTKELAKAFYGLDVPSINHVCWQVQAAGGALDDLLLLNSTPSLGRINPLGEAIWHEEEDAAATAAAADTASSNNNNNAGGGGGGGGGMLGLRNVLQMFRRNN